MKVLKFGGAIVGNAEYLKRVREIVGAETAPIVVVSAFEGVTTFLRNLITEAREKGTITYMQNDYERFKSRHREIAVSVVPTDRQQKVLSEIDGLYDEIETLIKGVCISQSLDRTLYALFLSYGEKLSSVIIAGMLDAELADSSKLIRTKRNSMKRLVVNEDETKKSVNEYMAGVKGGKPVVFQGFVAASPKGGVTTLGTGSSDLTATVLAAALNAEEIQIWKTEDGFMSADPKKVDTAYLISHMSYDEARELSLNGIGAIYSDAIPPAAEAGISIKMLNINNPDGEGTLISDEQMPEDKVIKGIGSQDNCLLYTISGYEHGTDTAIDMILTAELTRREIPMYFYSCSPTACSISICVPSESQSDVEQAFDHLVETMRGGISRDSIHLRGDVAVLVIVGENMKNTTGTAGKLFNSLGRNNINIVAMSQGSSETSISCVVDKKDLAKSLDAIHESFFLTEYQELNIFVTGTGTVGGSLLEQLHTQKEMIMKQNNVKLNVIGIADVDHYILDKNGVDLTKYRELLPNGEKSTPETLKKALFDLNAFNCVFVDCTASPGIAAIYGDLLRNNISVVCANKIAASGDYDYYWELKQTARQRGIKYLFETNVGAGLPIINTIGALIYSGDRILKLEAVLSGTLNFIFNTISEEIPLSKAIRMAMEARFAEPDPRIDLSGKDVIRKLVILARESGLKVSQEDVEKKLFIPNDFFEGTLDDFWTKIEKFDDEFEAKRKVIASEGKRWRFVATLDNGKTSVGLQAVDSRHPFYDLEGSNNLIIINTARYKDPMMIRGYGAGAAVTAAGVFADIISIANIR